jgi:hypothetical protein
MSSQPAPQDPVWQPQDSAGTHEAGWHAHGVQVLHLVVEFGDTGTTIGLLWLRMIGFPTSRSEIMRGGGTGTPGGAWRFRPQWKIRIDKARVGPFFPCKVWGGPSSTNVIISPLSTTCNS